MADRRIQTAEFPEPKNLDSFGFTAILMLNKTQVLKLARCEWVDRRENVIALGSSGTRMSGCLGLVRCSLPILRP